NAPSAEVAMSQVLENTNLQAECRAIAERAHAASRKLATLNGAAKDRWLTRAAEAIRRCSPEILEANARDVEAAPGHGLSSAAIDRLTLDSKRIESIAQALEAVVHLPDPVGEV